MSSRTTMLFFAGAGILGIPLVCAFFLLFFFAPVGGLGASAATCKAIADASSTLPPGAGGGTVRPVKDIAVSSGFGPRTSPTGEGGEFHGGADYPDAGDGGMGAPIYAYADGTVVASGPASGFGQWIVINHNIGGQLVSTVYGHMFPDGRLVQKGEHVKAGQVIAKIGANGNVTGPHLHFEYWPGGRFNGGHPIDPVPYVQAAREPGTAAPNDSGQAQDQLTGNDNGNGAGNDNGEDPAGFQLPKPDGPGEQNKDAGPIPSDYLQAYKDAGKKYGLPWELIAGIGFDETSNGQSNEPGVHSGQNSAGAMGPMQFLQGTWDTYGVDGNGDGTKNVYDIADAAFGTANYLVASGAKNGPQGVWNALYAYNHLHSYGNDVLKYAWEYATGKVVVVPGGGGDGQCDGSGGVLINGGDTSKGTKGANPKDLKLDWPAETATVDDPTTSGKITPRMKALLDALQHAPSKPASIGCWRPADQFPDHPSGHACDLMFTPANTPKNIDAGWAMANWLVANQKVLGVKYVIWQGRIWTSYKEPEHWRPYTVNGCPDPSQVTVCHYDHVHVTVY